jgi:predicted nucleic acid-binding protein
MAEGEGKIRIYYWDACVFLSFIEGRADRLPDIDATMDEAERGECQLWSSHLSIVEVAYGKTEKDGRSLHPQIEKEIDNLWHPDSPVKLAEVSHLICIGARALIRGAMVKQVGVRSADAVHLATARIIGVDEFHTYDGNLLTKCADLVPFKICPPHPFQPLLTSQPPAPPPLPPPSEIPVQPPPAPSP